MSLRLVPRAYITWPLAIGKRPQDPIWLTHCCQFRYVPNKSIIGNAVFQVRGPT